MDIKIYINILIVLISIVIVYYAINYGNIKAKSEAFTQIKLPNNDIDIYEIRELKKIVDNQNHIINNQKNIIDDYITKKNIDNNKFYRNEIKPEEDVEEYFKKIQEENDKEIKKNIMDDIDILDYYKSHLEVVKSYLEDPVTRGSNIYESEQYSKLLEVGNINLNNGVKLPHPNYWSINIDLQNKQK